MVLRYFPLASRLQRLYMSSKTAMHMRWHKEGVRRDSVVISHPTDGEAWKQFDLMHPEFSSDCRNIRLGLCTDGFNPFTSSSTPYSCWPIFLTLYNLPPGMCMDRRNLFLTLVIPSPKSLGKSIDVCLRPLIDELLVLWNEGICTFDAHRKQNFNMKGALM